MAYAIIRLGGKQYRVSEGQRLLVDRLKAEAESTFKPDVLFVGGDGASDGATVTAQVVGHTLGPKIRIGKYKKRTGYRRHTGHRSKLSEIEIQSIGAAGSRAKKAPKAADAKTAEAPVKKAKSEAAPAKLPKGYEDMTVAQIGDEVKSWNTAQVEAALAYERDHAGRKGAISALDSALERED